MSAGSRQLVLQEEVVSLVVESPLADDKVGTALLDTLHHVREVLLLGLGKAAQSVAARASASSKSGRATPPAAAFLTSATSATSAARSALRSSEPLTSTPVRSTPWCSNCSRASRTASAASMSKSSTFSRTTASKVSCEIRRVANVVMFETQLH